MKTRKSHFALFSALLLLSFTAKAGPFLTDDPEPVSDKEWEIEVNSTLIQANGDPDEKSAGIELKYGFMPNAEMFLALEYSWHSQNDEIPSLHGIGDSEIGVKYRFIQESLTMPQVALVPTLGIPTGNGEKDLGNDKVWVELPIWLEKNCNAWSSSWGGGVVFNGAPEARNFLFAGWKLRHEFSDHLNLGAELFYQGADSTDNHSITLVNVGGTYHVNKKLAVELSAGHNITGQNQTIAYLGICWSL